MLAVRKYGPLSQVHFLLIVLLAFPVLLSAQESAREKEKEKEARKNVKTNMVNITGKLRCEKPSPNYSIEVPDRPGHALVIEKRKCTWTEPLVILGGKTKDGVWVAFMEQMEGSFHPHTYEVDKLDDGETIAMQTIGGVEAEKGPTTAKGRFSFTRGTGKYKGIKGGGTYEGNVDADNVMTLALEGVYEPAEMAGGKK